MSDDPFGNMPWWAHLLLGLAGAAFWLLLIYAAPESKLWQSFCILASCSSVIAFTGFVIRRALDRWDEKRWRKTK